MKKASQRAVVKDRQSLTIYDSPEDIDSATAEALSRPEVRAASIIQKFDDNLDLTSLAHELKKQTDALQSGDMSRPEAMLVAQAHTLDALFSNLARRAQAIMEAGNLDAGERYMRLGLKAQAQTIRTIEALGELKNPKHIAFVAQANIAHGHQQINNGSRAQEYQNRQIKLSAGVGNELYQDTRTSSVTGKTNQGMETLGAVHRSKHPRR